MKVLSILWLLCISVIPAAAMRLEGTTRRLSNQNIVEVLASKSSWFSTLSGLVEKDNDLIATLTSNVDHTLFAPTNMAFEKITARLGKLSPEQIIEVLKYHVAVGKTLSNNLSDGQEITTLRSGSTVKVGITQNFFSKHYHINGALVIYDNLEASNGVIHVIDEVLLPEDLVSNTIVDILGDYPAFSTLVGLLETFNLTEAVRVADDVTLVAPTNDAFEEVESILARLVGVNGTAKIINILKYHVLTSIVYSDDLVDGQQIETLFPTDDVNVVVNENSWFLWTWRKISFSGATVFGTEIQATNGIIHAVRSVMIPPSIVIPSTLADVANGNGLSTLVQWVQDADLEETIRDSGPFTVFAPTNAAFKEIESFTSNLSQEQKTQILKYHIVSGAVVSTSLSDGAVVETLLPQNSITVHIDEGTCFFWWCSGSTIFINESEVIIADVEASNGVIHLIDKVLIPPSIEIPNTIVDVASENENLSQLVSLLVVAGLDDVLRDNGPYTVFAPTDAAFTADSDRFTGLSNDELATILRKHVVSGKSFEDDLSDNQILQTLSQGSTVTVNINQGTCYFFGWFCTPQETFIDTSEVITADLEASNGVIHVIDKVL